MGSPRIVSEEWVYRGRRVSLKKVLVEWAGRRFLREVVAFGEAVAIVPVLGDGRVVLLEQYRPPVDRWVLEVPAGVVEPGESPADTARRELVEETGYEPGELEKLGSIHTTPGYSDEVLHIYLATRLRFVGSRPEEYEVLRTRVLKPVEAFREVVSREPSDAKTVVALTLYLLKRGVLGMRTG